MAIAYLRPVASLRICVGNPEVGGSPLLQQGGAGLQSSGKSMEFKGWALALDYRGQR
jgi:hypothetical protein